jgi:hypothetical protein
VKIRWPVASARSEISAVQFAQVECFRVGSPAKNLSAQRDWATVGAPPRFLFFFLFGFLLRHEKREAFLYEPGEKGKNPVPGGDR